MSTTFVYAQLNSKIMPINRGEWFEDPLAEALSEKGFGEVTGGGTMQSETGEIEYCGIDLDLSDLEQSIPFVADALEQLGAPRGSKLQYEVDGQKVEKPFGVVEGLALYLNGSELSEEVYQQCDVNFVCDELDRLLGEEGALQSHWEGPTETALYLYGASFEEMRKRIAPLVKDYPLCQKCRIVQIA